MRARGSEAEAVRHTAWVAALLLVIAFFCATAIVWVRLDTVPPLWDQSQYLYESELLYHTLRQQGPAAFLSAFSVVMGSKAPLITALPLPLYALIGESHLTARYVNVAFIVLAAWYLYRLGTLLAGRGPALLAVVLLNTFPLVAGMSRQFLVEYGLMALTIVWMYYLVLWQRGERRWSPWALGIVLGFGLLMKVSFPLYVAAPTALVVAHDLARNRGLRRSTLRSFARVVALATPIAWPWYSRNWRTVFGFVLEGGFGFEARGYGRGEVFSLRTAGTYWLELVNYAVGGCLAVLLAVVASSILYGLARGENRSGLARTDLLILLAWWVLPWLALTLAVNKDYRYVVSYLPALALILSAGWQRLTRGRFEAVALALSAAVGLATFGFNSFATHAGVRLQAAGLTFLSNDLRWAHPPTREHWPYERAHELVTSDARELLIAHPRATVLFSHPRLNAHNLNYLSALHQDSARFNTIHFHAPGPAAEWAGRIRAEMDYVLTKSASPGPEFLNVKNLEILELLRQTGFPFQPVGAVFLPDGSEVTVFRRQGEDHRIWRPGEYEEIAVPVSAARFGGSIELVSSAVEVEAQGSRISLTWRCTAPMDEDYRVFVHAFDDRGGLHAIADHYPAGGRYGTSRWEVGEVIEDEVWIHRPPPPELRIYVGWYREAGGSQLPVEGGGAPEAGEPNAVRID